MSEIEESRVRENLTHGIDEGTLVYNLSSTLHYLILINRMLIGKETKK